MKNKAIRVLKLIGRSHEIVRYRAYWYTLGVLFSAKVVLTYLIAKGVLV